MADQINTAEFELIYVVVDHGIGSRVLHKAKEHGIPGATVFLGKGTVSSALMKFLSLYDERKEIVLMGADKETADHAMSELNREFQFEKPHHGIAFSISACSIMGSRCFRNRSVDGERGGIKQMYKLIITIVNKGNAEDVISAAVAAGSKGGTILNARGSGINETARLFNMEIEPEKEVVMILSKEASAENIVRSISEALELDKPGNGIIFVQDVSTAYGVFE